MKPIQYFRPKVGKGLRSNTWQRYQTILLKIQIILWPYSIKLVNPPLRPWWSLSCFQFQRTRKWSGLHPSWVSSPGSTPNVVRSERKISNLNLMNFYSISYSLNLKNFYSISYSLNLTNFYSISYSLILTNFYSISYSLNLTIFYNVSYRSHNNINGL